MKKITILIAFVSLVLAGYSQADSTLPVFNPTRGNLWYKASGVPAYKIDGYRVKIVDGDTLVRSTSEPFRAEELQIMPDGSDQKAQIESVATTIKEIIFGTDTARQYTANDSIDFKGAVIRFRNGAQLKAGTATLKIKNAVVDADDNAKIFDGNVILDQSCTTVKGYISAKWWGAKGDGTTDDATTIQYAAKTQRQNVVLPPGDYRINSGIKIDSTSSFDGSRGVFVAYGSPRTWITIGSDSMSVPTVNATRARKYYIRITRATQSDWADSLTVTDIGLLARNLYQSELKYEVNGFTFNAIMRGEKTAGGFEQSNIYPINSSNAFVNIWCTRIGNGYFNSNYIHAPSIRIDSDVNTGKRAYGIRFGTEGDVYLHNNNITKGGSIQLNGSNRVALDLIYSYQNEFTGWRNESNGIPVIFKNTSDKNVVQPGFAFAGTKAIDLSTGGNNIYEDPKDRILSPANSYTAFEWNAKGNSAAYNSTNNNLKGIGVWGGNGEEITYAPTTHLEIYPDAIKIKNTGLSIGAEFNTENTKMFLVKHTHRSDSTGRMLIVMYDANNNQLVTTAPKTGDKQTLYNSSWGGGWLTQSNTADDLFINLPDSCKKVRIAFVGLLGNANILKSFSITTLSSNSTNLSFKANTENIATAAPVWAGTYEKGQAIYNTSMSTSSLYWLTKTAGTNRTMTGASGSVTSGTNEVTVTGISTDSVYVGEYVNINSIRYKIGRVTAGKIFLTENVPSTYSGTINYVPAEFIEMKIGSGGSGGGGAFTAEF
ncbi:MAG TPA: hypothetical protein PL085_11510 [Agriterribacter sp.]|uniref:hypothetical protein n=1 Tax=Agriterribacter sp. TaxID=2821509 RepID=UPI002B620A69|nr:hypothetical protein [Agriterribacter sp.]HRQ17696.1 hypothetical protein [Agriterribacter sp.]